VGLDWKLTKASGKSLTPKQHQAFSQSRFGAYSIEVDAEDNATLQAASRDNAPCRIQSGGAAIPSAEECRNMINIRSGQDGDGHPHGNPVAAVVS
jgi:hypothetical protein